MNRLTLLTLCMAALFFSACSSFRPLVPVTGDSSALTLVVQAEEQAITAGEMMTLNYVVTNNGMLPLAGPVLVMDDPRQVFCPDVKTVGDLDSELDQNEAITCTAQYTVTEEDVNAGTVTSRARALVGGVTSNEVSTTVTLNAARDAQAASTAQLQTDATPTAFAASSATPAVSEPTSMPTTPTLVAAPVSSTQTPDVIPTATLGTLSEVTPGSATTPFTDPVYLIEFPAGSDTVVLSGAVPANGRIIYGLDASEGQNLQLNLVAAEELALTVSTPDGLVIKSEDAASSWTGTIPASGFYHIEVLNTTGASDTLYVLQVTLSP